MLWKIEQMKEGIEVTFDSSLLSGRLAEAYRIYSRDRHILR